MFKKQHIRFSVQTFFHNSRSVRGSRSEFAFRSREFKLFNTDRNRLKQKSNEYIKMKNKG